MTVRHVSTAGELAAATADVGAVQIVVSGTIADAAPILLAPGQSLSGEHGASIRFANGVDGIGLTANNLVSAIAIQADPDRRVIHLGDAPTELGNIALSGLRLTGCVRLLVSGCSKNGHFELHDIVIDRADARGFEERPVGFGVEVVPAVFTLWNLQSDTGSRVTAKITGISAGTPGAPVRGGGVFVGGTPGGGGVFVSRLETEDIHSDGGIAQGTPDRISGGVFVVHGAWVDDVLNRGPVTTYGPNDMVLDNWGSVANWTADAKITSFGASGIGFVNFGQLDRLRVNGIIETHGLGARGFNVYDGSVRDAEFEQVVTRADGAVGLQISRPVGRIAVRRGIETFGAIGESLVKGVLTMLPATPLSVKPGGSAREISVEGGIVSHGDGIVPFELHGRVEKLSVTGGFGPLGPGFQAILAE